MAEGNPSAAESDSTEDLVKRRNVLKATGSLGVATVLAGTGLTGLSRTALAVDFTASSLTLTTNSGQVTDVYVQPQNLDYSWSGLDSDPAEMTFTVYVDTPSQNGSTNTDTALIDMATLGSESDGDISSGSTEGYAGSDSYSFTAQYSLITDGPWSQSDFKNTNDGTTHTVQSAIEVVVEGKLTTEAGTTYTNTRRDQFDVEVTNESARVGGGGGNAGTGGAGL